MPKLTINFLPCDSQPSGGYSVFYRESGSSEPYVQASGYYASPIIIIDSMFPDATNYEGYFKGVILNSDTDCPHVNFNTATLPVNCTSYELTTFGADSASYSVHGLNCDGSPFTYGGKVGKPPPSPICAITGSVETLGNVSAQAVGSCGG